MNQELKFSKTHEWVKVEGNIATIGLTDFAQEQLGDIVYAEPEPEGTVVELEGIIGTVESVKAASDLYAPVSGEIVEANVEIEDEPEMINRAPWETWFVKIEMDDLSQLDVLLDQDAYDEFCKEEQA
ncbi:MAG: glycine cleavage system protein GcvH [Clostridiales bacterium]|jgi:glycine cleavage system H protein|nr:glycine cleavage system protein GcvH [Clostridiales bacterium]MDD2572416.1 glycine cleavage system protein GcvH [Eubacteriales bacterium]MDY0119116.1 glycine cleavage system protein GcvH [Clostridia bacterium]NLG29720.1 glycine cleavage system protein GcvH [Clostridiaceae bacterium]MCK9350801.1 glycine cleavage system protein GcvH [Clostridiales bacterium]